MSLSGRSLLVATLFVAAAPLGCSKKPASSQPVAAPSGGAPGQASASEGGAQAEAVRIRASVEGVGDMLAAARQLGERVSPDTPLDPKAAIQAQLLQSGFGPGFFSSLDLDGLHAVALAFPAGSGDNPPTEVAGSVAVVDARQLIEGMPASMRPQPLGGGMWELIDREFRMLLREQAKSIEFGYDAQDLDRAAKLRGEIGPGRRVRVRATNIDAEGLAPGPLDELPPKLRDDITQVLRATTAAVVEGELGTDRDFELVAAADAPFHRLGLEPLGNPRVQPSRLESRLPGGPVAAMSLSWGNPKLLHKMLDQQARVEQIPDPFADLARRSIASAHEILDQIANDVVVALYLSRKGEATFLIAADVRDEAKTKAALRTLNDVIRTALDAQRKLANDKSAQIGVSWKPGGVKVSGGKADLLSVTIPKDSRKQAEPFSMFLRKNRFESVAFVGGDTAAVALGAGARALVTGLARQVGKPGRGGLDKSTGLASLRAAMAGCQICTTIDPIETYRFLLQFMKRSADDNAQKKAAGKALKSIPKIGMDGEAGFGLKLEREHASAGMVVQKSLLFAPVADWRKIRDFTRLLNDEPETPPPPAGRAKSG